MPSYTTHLPVANAAFYHLKALLSSVAFFPFSFEEREPYNTFREPSVAFPEASVALPEPSDDAGEC